MITDDEGPWSRYQSPVATEFDDAAAPQAAAFSLSVPKGMSESDFDDVVRTVYGEAASEPELGQQAVAAVIANRARQSGRSHSDIVKAPWQFEPWMTRRRELESLDPTSDTYQSIAKSIFPVLNGDLDDPTGGATHFYAPRAQRALGRAAPSWDNGTGVDLGNHRFFNLGYGGKGPHGIPQQTASTKPAPLPGRMGLGGDVAAEGDDEEGPDLWSAHLDPDYPDDERPEADASERFALPPAIGAGDGPWAKYAKKAPAGPWEKYSAPAPIEAPRRSDPTVGNGVVENIFNLQQYKELAKGPIPGGINMVGSTLQGVDAQVAHGQYNARDFGAKQFAVMDRIDRGESVPETDDPMGYQHMGPEDRKAARAELTKAQKAFNPTPIQERPFYKGGEWVKEQTKGILPAAPGYEQSWGRQVGEGLGSMLAGIPFAMLGPVPAGVFFGAGGAGEATERAVEFDKKERKEGRPGLTQEQIALAGVMGVAPGTTDILPIETLMGRIPLPIPEALKRPLARAIGRIGGQAFVEGFQEGGQQFLQNLIAREVYNPDQDLGEGVPGNVAVGGAVGALAEGSKEVGSALLRRRGGHGHASKAVPEETPQIGGPPKALPAPGSTVPEPSAPPPPTSDETGWLRAYGFDADAIAEMSSEERAAAIAEAKASGVTPTSATKPLADDNPSAEPLVDLIAQARDLAHPGHSRSGLYLPRTGLDALSEADIEQLAGLIDEKPLLPNFDDRGGVLVLSDDATARWAEEAKARGENLQAIIGRVTGAGNGKPADGSIVVQQRTRDGAVARESLVTEADLQRAKADFAAPGRRVVTLTPEEALERRARFIEGETADPTLGTRASPVSVQSAQDLAIASERAVEPTEAQSSVGNYPKGHIRLHGLDISIETPKGAMRRGPGWEAVSPAAYGYVKGVPARSRDGEHVDVYVGDDPASDRVFVVNQVDTRTARFDEVKAILGVRSREEAMRLYDAAFSDGKGPERRRDIHEMSVAEFRSLLHSHDFKKPVSGGSSSRLGTGLGSLLSQPTGQAAAVDRIAGAKPDPLFSASDTTQRGPQTSRSQALAQADFLLGMGETVEIASEIIDDTLQAIESHLAIVPNGTNVGALMSVAPVGDTVQNESDKVRATFRDADGKRFSITLPWGTLSSIRAFATTDGGRIGFVRFALGNARPGVGGKLSMADARVGELVHEVVHILRRRGLLTGEAWSALLRHARSLKVLDQTLGAYLDMVGDPASNKAGDATIRARYRALYHSQDDLAERMNQEAVAHLLELHVHGRLTREQLAPVAGIVEDLMRGAMSGVNTSTQRRYSNSAMYAAAKSAPKQKPAIDRLGYYSKALEAAKSLQRVATPQQMRATLRSMGVKEAELAAVGLDGFLQGKTSVTKDDIVSFLRENRVEVKEGTYAGAGEQTQQDIALDLSLEIEEREANGQPLSDDTVAELEDYAGFVRTGEMTLDELRDLPADQVSPEARSIIEAALRRFQTSKPPANVSGPSKWFFYSIDPANPTYRETVIHLPENTNAAVEARMEALDTEARKLTRTLDEIGWNQGHAEQTRLDAITVEARELQRELDKAEHSNFTSGHWSEPNVIAHARTSLQKTSDGKTVFLIDELQSDWGQKLRDGGVRDEVKLADLRKRVKALQDEWSDIVEEQHAKAMQRLNRAGGGTLDKHETAATLRSEARRGNTNEVVRRFDAIETEMSLVNAEIRTEESATLGHPLVNTTDQWTTTAFRRLIRQAVEAGADYIALTPGKVQNERFNLAKQVSAIAYNPESGTLLYRHPGYDARSDRSASGGWNSVGTFARDELPNVVGKEVAAQLLATSPGKIDAYNDSWHALNDLSSVEIGGSGMKATYDSIYPRTLSKLLSKMDKEAGKMEDKSLKSSVDGRTFTSDREEERAQGWNNLDDFDTVTKKAIEGSPPIQFHTFPITDKVKESVMEDGQPLFAISAKAARLKAEGTAAQWINRNEKSIADWRPLFKAGLPEVAKIAEQRFQDATTDEAIARAVRVNLGEYLERQLDNPAQANPDVLEAVEEYNNGDPDGATEMLQDRVERQRTDILNRWKTYLTSTNPDYAADPFWRDYVWTGLQASMDANSPGLPPALMAGALSNVYVDIKEDPNSSPFQTLYAEEAAAIALEDSKPENLVDIGNAKTWVRIPQTAKHAPDFDKNIELVRSLSCKSWCTSQGMAQEYLPEGDFWVLTEDGQTRLSLRFEGDKVAEIQGPANNGRIPFAYAPDVQALVDSGDITLSLSSKRNLELVIQRAETAKTVAAAVRGGDILGGFHALGIEAKAIEDGILIEAHWKLSRDDALANLSDLEPDVQKVMIDSVTEMSATPYVNLETEGDGDMGAVSFPNLRRINGGWRHYGSDISLPNLKEITNEIDIDVRGSLTKLAKMAPALRRAHGGWLVPIVVRQGSAGEKSAVLHVTTATLGDRTFSVDLDASRKHLVNLDAAVDQLPRAQRAAFPGQVSHKLEARTAIQWAGRFALDQARGFNGLRRASDRVHREGYKLVRAAQNMSRKHYRAFSGRTLRSYLFPNSTYEFLQRHVGDFYGSPSASAILKAFRSPGAPSTLIRPFLARRLRRYEAAVEHEKKAEAKVNAQIADLEAQYQAGGGYQGALKRAGVKGLLYKVSSFGNSGRLVSVLDDSLVQIRAEDGRPASKEERETILANLRDRGVAPFDGPIEIEPQAQASLIGRAGISPEQQATVSRDVSEAINIVNRIAGKDVEVRFQETIDAGTVSNDQRQATERAGFQSGNPLGAYRRASLDAGAVIMLATSNEDLLTTAGHEAWHHVEEALASPAELRLLTSAPEMRRMRAAAGQEIGIPAGDPRLDALPDAEIRAIAFQKYRREKEEGGQPQGFHIGVRRFFDRMMRILAVVRNALNKHGLKSYEDVFEAARSGELADRPARIDQDADAYMASLIPAVVRQQTVAALSGITPKWLRNQWAKLPTGDEVRRAIQDQMIFVRRLEEQKAIQSGSAVPLHLSTYIASRLYPKAGEYQQDNAERFIEPMKDILRKNKISIDEFGSYLYARHAIERNAKIRVIDPTNNAGSGMSDAEATQILTSASPKQAAYDAAAKLIDDMIVETRERLLSAGLIDKATHDTWANQFSHYVPLRGFEAGDEKSDRPRTGWGFDIRGPEALQALGRRSKADNPVYYALLQANQAIVRAEKNRVDKTLYRFIQAYPDPTLYQVYKGEQRRRLNPITRQVETYWVQPAFARNDRVHGVKIGGKQYYMELKDPNLARAMRGVGGTQTGPIMTGAMKVARFYASLLTSYNPEFVVSNFFRDLQTALANVTDVANKPADIRRQILKEAGSLKSMRGIMAALYGHEGRTIFGAKRSADQTMLGTKRSQAAEDYAKWFDEYRKAGGKISFLEFNDVAAIQKDIEGSLKRGRFSRVARKALEHVNNLNTAVENGVRLSTYIALRKHGIAQDRAAMVARDLTVDFNLKGEMSSQINALYMFFNASLQGTTRMLRAIAKSRTLQVGVASIMGAAFMVDWFNYMVAGDDDDGKNSYDKIPTWIKERNMILMVPGAKDRSYVQIPMPYGYNLFWLGGQQTAAAIRGAVKPHEAALNIAKATFEVLSPIGGANGSFLQLISPTLLDPMVQIVENKTWYGGPIYPTKFNKHQPNSETFSSSIHPWFVDMARTLNRFDVPWLGIQGGNTAKAGTLDVSPEVIEHLVEFAGGGVAKFFSNIAKSGLRAYDGEEWLPEKTPFVRRLYGKATTESRRADFWKEWNTVDAARYEVDNLIKSVRKGTAERDEVAAAQARNRVELQAYPQMRQTQQYLAQLRKQRTEAQLDGSLSRKDREDRIKALTDRENAAILRSLNTLNQIRKQSRPERSAEYR